MNLVFSTAFFGNGLGGAEISVDLLIRKLQEKHHDVQVITTRKINLNQNTILLPFSNYVPKKVLIGGIGIIDFFLSYHIEKFLRRNHPDLIHIHDLYSLPASVNAALKLGLPIVVTIRDPLPRELAHRRGVLVDSLYKLIYKIRNRVWIKSLKRADKIIAISEFIKLSIEKLQIPSEKVEVIYNLPPSWNGYGKREYTSDKIILLAASRLFEEKGIHILLIAIDQIIKSGFTNIKLIIAGEGAQRKKLEYLCKTRGIEQYVKFLGRVPYNKLQGLYSICDIVILPSIFTEPFGRVALEAGVMGKPIIASNIGGIPEIIENGVTGILVPPNNPEKLTEAIMELIENEGLRKKMGENGRIVVWRKFNPEHIVSQHIKLYKDLVQ